MGIDDKRSGAKLISHHGSTVDHGRVSGRDIGDETIPQSCLVGEISNVTARRGVNGPDEVTNGIPVGYSGRIQIPDPVERRALTKHSNRINDAAVDTVKKMHPRRVYTG